MRAVLKGHRRQPAIGHFTRHGGQRQQRHAHVPFHQRFHAVQFRHPMFRPEPAPVSRVAGFDAVEVRDFGPGDEQAAFEHLRSHAAQRGEGMFGMADEHERFTAKGHNGQAGPVPGIGDQPQVHRVAAHELVHVVNPAAFHADVGEGMGLPEAAEDFGQVMQGDAVAGGQHKGVRAEGLVLLNPAPRFVVKPDEVAALFMEDQPGAGEVERVARAFDKLEAEPAFEVVKDVAGGGDGTVVKSGSPGNAAGAGQSD